MPKIKIVFSDIDGTLLNSTHQITPLTQQAIRALEHAQIPFVIVSARGPSGITPIMWEYGFQCPIICYSGALILSENGQVLFQKGFQKRTAKAIIELAEQRQFDLSWCLFSFDEWIVKDRSDPRIVREEKIVKAESKQGPLETIAGDDVHKILCICNPRQILTIEQELKKAFPHLSIAKSADHLLEIMERGVTKAAAVKQFCQMRQIAPADTAAFGDNYNDLEMLQTVGHGFFMENAPAELKRLFPCHTKDNDHDGIFFALRKMGLDL